MALRPITEEELNKISGQTSNTPVVTSTGTYHPSFSSLRVENPSNVNGVVPKVGQTPEKTFGEKLSSGIQKIFPGQKVGQAIGTLGGYLKTPQAQKEFYDTSAPTPGQVLADVAQGALTIGTGGIAKPTTAISKVAGLGSERLARATIPTARTAGKRILQNTAIGAGFGGTGAIAEGEDLRGVVKSTLIGAGAGLGLGLAGEGISAVAKLKPKPEAIMNRVARLTPSDARKFEQLAGKSHGQYLKETGNFGSPEQIIENEAKKFVTSVKDVDDTLAKLPGQFKARPIKTALDELVAREKRVSSPGAPSRDLEKAIILQKKHNTTGLTMSEINEAKRLYERNVKLEFNKFISPEGVARSTNVDRALRGWQIDEAKKLGFKNLDVLNKQTQLSKFIVDNLGKQLTGKSGNEAVNLTDWIVLSGGDPTAVSAFLAKRVFSNKGVQSRIAKALTKEAPIGQVKPKLQKLTQTKPVELPKLKKLPKKSYKDSKLPKLGKVKEQMAGSLEVVKKEYLKKLKEVSPNQPESWYKFQLENQPFVKNPEKFGFSKQKLDDIKQATNVLVKEAKKYKSAEEFVKAQGREVYHATDSEPFDVFDIGKAKKGETYFNPLGTGQYLSSNKEFVKRFGANTIDYVLPKNAKTKVVTLDSWANKDYPVIVKSTLKKLGIDYNDLDLDEKVLLNRQVPDSPIMSLNNAEVIIGDIAERFGKKGDIQKLIEQVSDSRNANYDAVIFRDTDSALKADEILIPKPSIIKTKSQLEEIWNKANKKLPPKPKKLK